MPTPKEEVEDLMDEFLPHALEKLKKYDALIPGALVLKTDGKKSIEVPYDENLSTLELLQLLEEGLLQSAKSGRLRAIAIFVDGAITDKSTENKKDALMCRLYHNSGYSVEVAFPYHKSDSGDITVSDPLAFSIENKFFETKPWWRLWS